MVDQPSPLVLPWFIRHNNYKKSITLQNKTKSFKSTKHLFLPIFLFLLLYKAFCERPHLCHGPSMRCPVTFSRVSSRSLASSSVELKPRSVTHRLAEIWIWTAHQFHLSFKRHVVISPNWHQPVRACQSHCGLCNPRGTSGFEP